MVRISDHQARVQAICMPTENTNPGGHPMKKLIAAALAAAMLTPVVAAPAQAKDRDRYERSHRHDKHDRYERHDRKRYSSRDRYRDRRDYRDRRAYRNHRYAHRSWRRGDRFDRRYVRVYRPVRYYDYRSRLYAPPRGHRWVRADNDALLIGITSGIVSAIVSDAFYRR